MIEAQDGNGGTKTVWGLDWEDLQRVGFGLGEGNWQFGLLPSFFHRLWISLDGEMSD